MEKPALLPTNKSRDFLKNIDGWHITEDHKIVFRDFALQDFMNVINFINDIATIAQDEDHHPDVHLTQYRNLRVCLTSHEVGGLTEKDFSVASRINHLSLEPKKTKKVDKASRTSKAKKSLKSKKPIKAASKVTRRKSR